MKQFLLFRNETDATARNRELMETKRKPGNPDGDGKPYGTTGRHSMRVAEDGQAVLEIADGSGLTADEQRALVSVRPSKFDPPEDSDR